MIDITVEQAETIIAFIKNHEREDIPEEVWDLCMELQGKCVTSLICLSRGWRRCRTTSDMKNRDMLMPLTDADLYDQIDYLLHVYGRNFTDTRGAIIEWLGTEYDSNDVFSWRQRILATLKSPKEVKE